MSAKNFSGDSLNSLLNYYKMCGEELPGLMEEAVKPENQGAKWEKAE